MVIGTTLFKLDGTPYYSPSFPRGGLSATFAVSVTHMYGSPTFTITVQHRDRNATTWDDAGSFTSISSSGESVKDLSTLKEVIRFKYTFDAGDDATDAVHFEMQAPSWRPY